MRIRKRTPVRAASPPGLCCLSPPPPKEVPRDDEDKEEDDAEEKLVILVGAPEGRQDQDIQVPVPASPTKNSAATDGELKPEKTGLHDDSAADKARCSRNDGKRWRCKSAAVPGLLFCDRHVAWSVRQRQPRAKKKKKNSGRAVLGLAVPTNKELEEAEEEDVDPAHDGSAAANQQFVRHADADGFFYYGGFLPRGRKRGRGAAGLGRERD